MPTVTEKAEWTTSTRHLGPGEVLDVDAAQDRVRLRLAGSDDDVGVWARIAVAMELKNGDTILAIGDRPDELYVIGLLNPQEAPATTPARLTLTSGAYAEAARTQGDETLRVYSGNNELLFEYDEARGRARINVEKGNLEFTVQDGSIVFASEREILFHGQSVGITALSGIRLGITDAVGSLISSLAMNVRRINATANDFGISATHGVLELDAAEYRGREFTGTLRSARLAVDRLETAVDTLFERAKNVYRTVEQLTQLRTGRLRTLVSSTFHFKARKASLKSEQDFKINAEKIHLG